MLSFQIDNLELENAIQQNYGSNTDGLVRDFVLFLKSRQIEEDVKISLEQIDLGETHPMNMVMEELRNKYE